MLCEQNRSQYFLEDSICIKLISGYPGLYAFNSLNYLNISGDGVPNRPQKEPPIEYPQDQAVQIIFIVALSAITAVISISKIFRLR